MADKEKRLAAARKKLKVFKEQQQHQQRNGGSAENEGSAQELNGIPAPNPEEPLQTSAQPIVVNSNQDPVVVFQQGEPGSSVVGEQGLFGSQQQQPPSETVRANENEGSQSAEAAAEVPTGISTETSSFQNEGNQPLRPLHIGFLQDQFGPNGEIALGSRPLTVIHAVTGTSFEVTETNPVHKEIVPVSQSQSVETNHFNSWSTLNNPAEKHRQGPMLNREDFYAQDSSQFSSSPNDRSTTKEIRPPMSTPQYRSLSPDVYELELSQLREENRYLQSREVELVTIAQNLERKMQEIRHERDESRQELRSQLGPLKQKATIVTEENQELKRRIDEMTLQLSAALEEKKEQGQRIAELDAALITLSKAKMALAEELDAEKEELRALKPDLIKKHAEVHALTIKNQALVSQIDAMEKQTQAAVEETRRTRLHEETQLRNAKIQINQLEKELAALKAHNGSSHALQPSPEQVLINHHEHSPSLDSEHVHIEKGTECLEGVEVDHDHDHGQGHGHSHSHGNDHDHDHDHSQDHSNDHGHGHSHGAGSDHGHGHSHGNGEEEGQNHVEILGQFDANQPTPMEKKLARLEWENGSFRQELDRLAVLLKANTVDYNTYNTCLAENERMKLELSRLEHLVVQLQGENDTIGDYVALYQGQRLALKERAREKEVEMATLSVEREKLRLKMEELNLLLTNYKEGEKPVEKINELIAEISTNFHPCGLCSGRLMNV